MQATIKHQIYVKTTNKFMVDDLRKQLTYKNPEFAKKQAMGYATYNIESVIATYEPWNQGIIIPRGCIPMLRKTCEKYNESFEITNQQTSGTTIDVQLSDHITPYPYQTPAIASLIRYRRGMLEAPCASGKTVIGLALTAHLKKRTLIIVHTDTLFKQWQNDILGTSDKKPIITGKFTIGVIGGGKRYHGDITIAMVQSLIKTTPAEWELIRQNYGIVLWDESHHAGADSYVKCIKNVQGEYNIGLTATPIRKDKKNFLIENYLGPIIHQITYEELEANDRTVSCNVNLVSTGCRYDYTSLGNNSTRLSSTVSNDVWRNDIIVNNICTDIENGRTPIALTERTIHTQILVSKLRERGILAELIIGAIPSYIRDKILTNMHHKRTQVLIANKIIAAEGLDLPILDSVHICFQTFNKNLIKQMIGRGRRTYEDKDFCQVWYYHDYVYTLAFNEHTMDRSPTEVQSFKYGLVGIRKWFIEQGFKINDITN